MTWLTLETMELKKDGVIAVLTLTRINSLNAMSPAFFDNIKQVINELSNPEHGIRALIITGLGSGVFCWCRFKKFFIRSKYRSW